MRSANLTASLLFVLVAGLFITCPDSPVLAAPEHPLPPTITTPKQTDVERAQHGFDAAGVPVLEIKDIGRVYHPAWIALYALQYAGLETYDDSKPVAQDPAKFRACVQHLAKSLRKNRAGDWVWEYPFDSTYNDVTIHAPWSSAFGQAVGIQALLAAYSRSHEPMHLEAAERAARALFRPIREGGLLFEHGEDVWFEEIPVPVENPTHILNGHMRALLAIKELSEATGRKEYRRWLRRGIQTLEKWLPLYDTSYWLRYDLNPKKEGLWFRFTNPYGETLPPLAVEKVTLRDPLFNQERVLEVGAREGAGATRIEGSDWGPEEELDGRRVRRLKSVSPADPQDERQGQLLAPATYFYLSLPSDWKDNLRTDWFELFVSYKDERPGYVTVQARSIAPGPAFRDVRGGDLLLKGSGEWRRWGIPIRVTDLGWWVGQSYADKHADYLTKLAHIDPRLEPWATAARGYARLTRPVDEPMQPVTELKPLALPTQTPLLPVYSLDEKGVVRQHLPTAQTRFIEGRYDKTSHSGTPVYHFFHIATQFMKGEDARFEGIDPAKIRRKPAADWLLDARHFRRVGDAQLYRFDFTNAYNDVETPAPWQSAFGQIYVFKAFYQSRLDTTADQGLLRKQLIRVFNGFQHPVKDGGLVARSKSGLDFAEEVPNETHILNAHMTVTSTLIEAGQELNHSAMISTGQSFLHTLREYAHLYDAGYWTRYDLNPKKEILLQIALRSGDAGPAIDAICFENPQTGDTTCTDVGAPHDRSAYPPLVGSDWGTPEVVDGRTVRRIRRSARGPVGANGEVSQQTMVTLALPTRVFRDVADVPPHRLIIRYKDDQASELSLYVQRINRGSGYHVFPIRRGWWTNRADGRWKQAVFEVRPQDMGWYSGPEYQQVHVEEVEKVAARSHDWYLTQVAERWRHYLEEYRADRGSTKRVVALTAADPGPSFVVTASVPGSKAQARGIVLAADDPSNPLSIMRIPIRQEVVDIASVILRGEQGLTPHEKVIRFMDSMKEFRIGEGPSEPSEVMRQQVGACGSFTNVLLALAWTQGIPGRYVNLHNFPAGAGHTVAELFIDGKWRVYDPTYGVYYTGTPRNDRNPNVLSFEELKRGKGRDRSVRRVVRNQRRVDLAPTLARQFIGPAIYERAVPGGPIVPDRPWTYPLSLDLVKKPTVGKDTFGLQHQGAEYIGSGGICIRQEWTLTSLHPGQRYELTIEPDHLSGEAPRVAGEFSAGATIEAGGTITSGAQATFAPGRPLAPWVVEFRAHATSVKLSVAHPYCGTTVHYLKIRKYELKRRTTV